MSGIAKFKAGCEQCPMDCRTYIGLEHILSGVDLMSEAGVVPVTTELMPDIQEGKRARVVQNLIGLFRKPLANELLPEAVTVCAGPDGQECPYEEAVYQANATFEHLYQTFRGLGIDGIVTSIE